MTPDPANNSNGGIAVDAIAQNAGAFNVVIKNSTIGLTGPNNAQVRISGSSDTTTTGGTVAISNVSGSGGADGLQAAVGGDLPMSLSMNGSTLASPSVSYFDLAGGTAAHPLVLSGSGNTGTGSPIVACNVTSGTISGSIAYNGAAHCP